MSDFTAEELMQAIQAIGREPIRAPNGHVFLLNTQEETEQDETADEAGQEH